jgi:hypothetical protein
MRSFLNVALGLLTRLVVIYERAGASERARGGLTKTGGWQPTNAEQVCPLNESEGGSRLNATTARMPERSENERVDREIFGAIRGIRPVVACASAAAPGPIQDDRAQCPGSARIQSSPNRYAHGYKHKDCVNEGPK